MIESPKLERLKLIKEAGYDISSPYLYEPLFMNFRGAFTLTELESCLDYWVKNNKPKYLIGFFDSDGFSPLATLIKYANERFTLENAKYMQENASYRENYQPDKKILIGMCKTLIGAGVNLNEIAICDPSSFQTGFAKLPKGKEKRFLKKKKLTLADMIAACDNLELTQIFQEAGLTKSQPDILKQSAFNP